MEVQTEESLYSDEQLEAIDQRKDFTKEDLDNTKEFELIMEVKEYALYRPLHSSIQFTEGEFFILDKWRGGIIEIRNYDIVGLLKLVARAQNIFEFETKTFEESDEGKKQIEKLNEFLKERELKEPELYKEIEEKVEKEFEESDEEYYDPNNQ